MRYLRSGLTVPVLPTIYEYMPVIYRLAWDKPRQMCLLRLAYYFFPTDILLLSVNVECHDDVHWHSY